MVILFMEMLEGGGCGEKTIWSITLKSGCKLFWRDEFLWNSYGKEMEKQDWIEG